MSNTLKTILTFSIIIVASFFILLGAIYVQNLPAPVITPPPIATSTPIVWNPADINSKDVSITVLEKTADNPAMWEIQDVLADSQPNLGYATSTSNGAWPISSIQLQPNEVVQIGCIPHDEIDPTMGCQAVLIQ